MSGFLRIRPYEATLGILKAAVGVAQLKALPERNEERIELTEKLTEQLESIEGGVPPRLEAPGSQVYWMYQVQLERGNFRVGMDQIQPALNAEGLAGMFAMYYLIPHSHHFLENREREINRLVNARSHLEKTLRFSWTHKLTDANIDDTAELFAKVADAYRA